MWLALKSITDEKFEVEVKIQESDWVFFIKTFEIVGDPVSPSERTPENLERRAYRMTNKLVETILSDPEFKRAFLKAAGMRQSLAITDMRRVWLGCRLHPLLPHPRKSVGADCVDAATGSTYVTRVHHEFMRRHRESRVRREAVLMVICSCHDGALNKLCPPGKKTHCAGSSARV